MEQFIDKHAIANEVFEFKCPYCGNLIQTKPGILGKAQTTCKNCGHTIIYQVDPPRKPGNHNAQMPISVRLYPFEKEPGDYQIIEPLIPNTDYCFLCPKCSKIHKITTSTDARCVQFKNCQLKLHFKVQNNSNLEQSTEIAPSTEKSFPETEPIPPDSAKPVKAYIEWGSALIRHRIELKEDATIIGRNLNKYPCSFKKSGCKTCWRHSNGSKKYPCDIMIKDKYMSACSLEIKKEIQVSGAILYKATVRRDYNPVLIQQHHYKVGSSIYLNDGDIIKMGKTTLTFKLIEEKS